MEIDCTFWRDRWTACIETEIRVFYLKVISKTPPNQFTGRVLTDTCVSQILVAGKEGFRM